MFSNLYENFFNDKDRWLLWLPLFLVLGIYIYFKTHYFSTIFVIIVFFLFLIFLIFRTNLFLKFILIPTLLILCGIIRTNYYTEKFDFPVITEILGYVDIYGEVERVQLKKSSKNIFYKEVIVKVEKILPTEKSFKNFKENYNNFKIPKKLSIRLSIKDTEVYNGKIVINSIVYPISEKIYPTSFDFKLYYFFKEIGGLGYKGIVKENIKIEKQKNILDKIEDFRYNFGLKIINDVDKPSAGIIVTLLTGNKKLADQKAINDINYAGLSHLLAISGIHMVTIIGTIFFIVKWLLLRSEYIAIHFNVFKISAIISLILNFFYLALSGFAISAVRAYIMSVIFLFSIILEKFNFPLRAVMFVCFVMSFANPEIIFNPGFQMSFASVIALTGGYEFYQEKKLDENSLINRLSRNKIISYIMISFTTSILAELATTPFSIFHFNNYTFYNVLANFIAVPLITFFILPISVFLIPLYFFDLEKLLLVPVCYLVDIILYISNYIVNIPNSIVFIPSPSYFSMFLMIFGGLWFCIWKSKWKNYGLLIYAIGIIAIFMQKKPDLIIDYEKANFIITDENYNLYSLKKVDSFKKSVWANKLGKVEINDIEDFYNIECEDNCAYLEEDGRNFIYGKNNNEITIYKNKNFIKIEYDKIKKIKKLKNIDIIYL